MIKPISISKYPNFQNNSSKKQYSIIGKSAAESVETEQDFQRKLVEQNERLTVINGIQAIGIISGLLLINIKTLIEIFRKKGSNKIPDIITKFESLKNNKEIPFIEDCKSINKDLKDILQRAVNIINANKENVSKDSLPEINNRLLLVGPPGVGKSFYAKVYAKSINAEYLEILFSDVESRWAGEGIENMKHTFDNILKTVTENKDKRYVLVFNEIDSFIVPPENLSQSKGTHWVSILRERDVMLNYLEVFKEKAPNLTIIGTTNISPKNNGLDKAAVSRLQKPIEVSYPDAECLFEALKMKMGDCLNKNNFLSENEAELKNLCQKMEGRKFSFRNLESLINEAKGLYFDESLKNKNNSFTIDYLKKAEELVKFSDGEL